MLRASFICLPGIQQAAEQRLWRAGCLQWDQFASIGKPLFSAKKAENILLAITQAEQALTLERADYFLHRLPPEHKGRVLGDFVSQTAYLDVETTGLSPADEVTTAVVYKCGEVRFFVNGHNLFDIAQYLAQSKLLVTYNGTRFDVPLLQKTLGMDLLVPHLDLLPVTRSLGFRGGLKTIEKQLRIKRQSTDINGRQAAELWKRFQTSRDNNILIKLLTYNAEDAIVLEEILRYAFIHSMSGFPLKVPNPVTWEHPQIPQAVQAYLSEMHIDK